MESKFPFLMKSAALLAVLGTLVFLLLYHSFGCGWMLTCAISFGTTAYHFVMRLAVGFAVPKLTRYDFDHRARWFLPRPWEPAFYRKLNVRKWKGSIPTYCPGQFCLQTNSLHRVIQNMCGAEVVHEIIMALSFLPLLAVPVFGAFPVFLITSVLSALYDSIFVMAQRFNRPRLVRLHERQEAKSP